MSAHGDHDMGHTVAGWTGTALVLTGTVGVGAGLAGDSAAGLWLGWSVVALGPLASWVLHLTGWGKPTGTRPMADRHWRTRDTAARHGHPDCLGCRMAGRRPSAGEAARSVPAQVQVAERARVRT
ncbi:HGxxPAAW family protein [Streptomyces sp. BR1]|uniref:HGxxPAAW family protein n=1 Tax=Streptomyces sp. BR1 TaxID=1592323 RepID=UPI00402BD929